MRRAIKSTRGTTQIAIYKYRPSSESNNPYATYAAITGRFYLPNAFFLPAQKLQTLSYVSAARTKRRLSEKPSLKSSSSTPLLLIEFSPFYHRRPLFVNPSAPKKPKSAICIFGQGKKQCLLTFSPNGGMIYTVKSVQVLIMSIEHYIF